MLARSTKNIFALKRQVSFILDNGKYLLFYLRTESQMD